MGHFSLLNIIFLVCHLSSLGLQYPHQYSRRSSKSYWKPLFQSPIFRKAWTSQQRYIFGIMSFKLFLSISSVYSPKQNTTKNKILVHYIIFIYSCLFIALRFKNRGHIKQFYYCGRDLYLVKIFDRGFQTVELWLGSGDLPGTSFHPLLHLSKRSLEISSHQWNVSGSECITCEETIIPL